MVALSLVEGHGQQVVNLGPGIIYANQKIAEVPWSIHYVRIERSHPELDLRSTHARNAAIGMATLTAQIQGVKPAWGQPLAGLNGDFYQRDRIYQGDPRGLQIIDGELISAPTTGSSFWIDAAGSPHIAKMESRFSITWPDGTSCPLGLNEEISRDRGTNVAVLYTPAVGASTRSATNVIELVLERNEGTWLPLKVGETFSARVREVRTGGDAPLNASTMVLGLNPFKTTPKVEKGAVLKFSTATIPDVRGARTAISGGPVLVHEGQKQDFRNVPKAAGPTAQYSYDSMFQQHPRSALGWSDKYFFLMEVDGRQPGLSVGMKLEEVADYLMKQGCQEVMNLDGGGSATLWANGRVMNSPCDRVERPIANSLIVMRKSPSSASVSPNATK